MRYADRNYQIVMVLHHTYQCDTGNYGVQLHQADKTISHTVAYLNIMPGRTYLATYLLQKPHVLTSVLVCRLDCGLSAEAACRSAAGGCLHVVVAVPVPVGVGVLCH